MKETSNWKDVCKLPLNVDPESENFVIDSNGKYAFEVLDKDNAIVKEVIDRINGELPQKLLDNSGYYFEYRRGKIQLRGTDFLILRNFNNYTGDVIITDPIKSQKDFGEFICNQLNQSVLIYTSYFANIKKLPTILCPISIAGKAPDGWNGPQYKKLAPKYETWKNYQQNKKKDEHNAVERYVLDYYETVLDNRDSIVVVNDLLSLADGKIPCLICYEKPGEFCHRMVVTDWINRKLVREVEVLEYET